MSTLKCKKIINLQQDWKKAGHINGKLNQFVIQLQTIVLDSHHGLSLQLFLVQKL